MDKQLSTVEKLGNKSENNWLKKYHTPKITLHGTLTDITKEWGMVGSDGALGSEDPG